MTDRVQFREEEDTLAFVQSRGVNPNELARLLFQAEVRRMRAAQWLTRLRDFDIKLTRSAAEMVREDRDSH